MSKKQTYLRFGFLVCTLYFASQFRLGIIIENVYINTFIKSDFSFDET